jgi:hypothetical protein
MVGLGLSGLSAKAHFPTLWGYLKATIWLSARIGNEIFGTIPYYYQGLCHTVALLKSILR